MAHIAGVQHLVVGGDVHRALLQDQLCQQWTISKEKYFNLNVTKNLKT